MDKKLENAMAYLLEKYPHKDELSNGRVTKMIYLADWRQAIQKGQQITAIRWKFDNFGPFVWDVRETATESPRFKIEETKNYYGSPKMQLSLAKSRSQPPAGSGLTEDERAALDHVISQTKRLHWDGFIQLVYSTYPIMSSSRYTELDLVKKAEEYKTSSE